MATLLSKSRFLAGVQCPLLLWMQHNDRSAIPPPGAHTQQAYRTGHEVGELAKRLYPEGREVPAGGDRPDPAATAAATAVLLRERRPIFEAGFLVDEPAARRYARVDILAPAADGAWDLIEVKANTRVKPVNVWDVAYQADTLERAGLRLNRICVMHVDTDYERHGALDPARFFRTADVTPEARRHMALVPGLFARYAAAMTGPRPDVPIGPQCHDPFDCAMLGVCWRDLPPHNVTELHRAGRQAFEWLAEGYRLITELPDDALTPKQLVQKCAVASRQARIDRAAVRQLRDQLQYPLWYLDFESMNPAVPLFDGTRPYQQIPFQFSLHVQYNRDDPPRHIEYLCEEPVDPRPGLLRALQAIGPRGTVLAFNAAFEGQVLSELGARHPTCRTMTRGLLARLRDLAEPFRRWQIYHPEQHGRYSLKAVLPAFTDLRYDDLEIADGQTAGREYLRAVHGADVAPDERARVLRSLRAYCARDTLAMVELLQAFG